VKEEDKSAQNRSEAGVDSSSHKVIITICSATPVDCEIVQAGFESDNDKSELDFDDFELDLDDFELDPVGFLNGVEWENPRSTVREVAAYGSVRSLPKLDERLIREVDWYREVFTHLFRSGPILEWRNFGRVICEALASDGLLEVYSAGQGITIKLKKNYKRSGPLIVRLFSVLEIVSVGLSAGFELDGFLYPALGPENWRPVAPLPRKIKPLLRKIQRTFPVPLLRKMPAELFWPIALHWIAGGGLPQRDPA
jgi:hypothetical protein